jgi:hypothetical protein
MASFELLSTPPGRLGSPDLQLKHDPRADPRMLAELAPFGMDGAGEPPPVDAVGGQNSIRA